MNQGSNGSGSGSGGFSITNTTIKTGHDGGCVPEGILDKPEVVGMHGPLKRLIPVRKSMHDLTQSRSSIDQEDKTVEWIRLNHGCLFGHRLLGR